MKQKILAATFVLSGLCLNLKAEVQGDVVGVVLDDSGAPLVGATALQQGWSGEGQGELCWFSDPDFRVED